MLDGSYTFTGEELEDVLKSQGNLYYSVAVEDIVARLRELRMTYVARQIEREFGHGDS